MNENINLCEILKGHEGETFYSRCFGFLKLKENSGMILELEVISQDITDKVVLFPCNGHYTSEGEMDLFPSKDQRDWNKWDKENNHKLPKTWSEYCKIIPPPTNNDYKDYPFAVNNPVFVRKDVTPIEKSALALLKIHQLIEVGYGGNVTNEEWDKNYVCFVIRYGIMRKRFIVGRCTEDRQHIAFHTEDQAEEFLSKPENAQLLKDYFMI